jgi:hypothetical protein
MRVFSNLIKWLWISLFIFLGISLLQMKIPGYGAMCDADNMFYLLFIILFTILGGAILTYSFIRYHQRHKKAYLILIIFVLILSGLNLVPRNWIFRLYFKNEKYLLENSVSDPVIKIHLYENGDFFAHTIDFSCSTENVGTYILKQDTLSLFFKNKKSKYLDSLYVIQGNTVRGLRQNIILKLRDK